MLSPDEAAAFLEAAAVMPHGLIFEFALVTGMRPEEYLALQWSDVDLTTGAAQIKRAPGGAWPSMRKVPSWECQDMVLHSGSETFPAFLLADGASVANGSLAIEIARKAFNEWGQSSRVTSLPEAKQALCRLILNIGWELKRVSFTKRRVETTAVAVAIYRGGGVPTALIVSHGNSGCLITHEDAAKSSRMLYSSLLREATQPLGFRGAKLDPREALVEVPLTKGGVYHVRAFSDGVGDDSLALELLRGGKDIRQLVDEAAVWPQIFSRVGTDDWSVAGFDVTVRGDRPGQ